MKTHAEFLEELKSLFKPKAITFVKFESYEHGQFNLAREALEMIEQFEAQLRDK
jgi:hypothetical protein